jgi:hypothetical protein
MKWSKEWKPEMTREINRSHKIKRENNIGSEENEWINKETKINKIISKTI